MHTYIESCNNNIKDVSIGFQSPHFFTKENVSARATVCAQINNGSLEREVAVYT